MTYAVRNSIVLAILLILVNGAGWFALVMPTRKQVAKLRKEVTQLDQKLLNDANLPDEIEKTKKEIIDSQKRWQERKKVLPRDENTRDTYNFVNRMVNNTNKPFPFDFDFNEQHDTLGLTMRRYSFRSDVTYPVLFEFIHHLENHKRLLVLTELQMDLKPLTEGEDSHENLTTFNAKMVAYSAPNGATKIDDEIAKTIPPKWNPFKALVSDRLPRNDRGLIEVDRAKLIAISAQQAFLQDQGGKLIPIKEGDPVYLGFVTRVDAASAQVEFTLNYGGFVRRRKLDLVRESVVGGAVRSITPPPATPGQPQ